MRALIPAVLLASALNVHAADKRPFTVDDLWSLKRVGAPSVSPDGRTVAYTVSTWSAEENKSNADVWLVPMAGGEPRRLTTHKASDSSPAWSPDGRRIAFVSKRDGDAEPQLYVMPVDGGEPERVSDMPLGVSDPLWLPDGKRIAFVSHVIAGAESLEETRKALEIREKDPVKAHVSENRLYRYWDRWLTDDQYPHIFLLDLETRKPTDLLPGSKRYFGLRDGGGSFDVSPDGGSIAFEAQAAEPPYRSLNTDVYLVPTAGGELRDLTAANLADDGGPVFSPDGTRIAYGLQRRSDEWPDYTRLAVLELASGRTTVLTEAFDDSVGAWHWTRDGAGLVFEGEQRARTNLYRIDAAGGTPRELRHGGSVSGNAVAADGQVVFRWSALDRPPELGAVSLDGGGFRALTTTNDALLGELALGEAEEIVFEGAAGDRVQMFLLRPPGFDASRKYPLLQLVHGGPEGSFGDEFHFRWNAQAFAAPGYLVAMVNFHGSTGFGHAFVESIMGAHGDKPFADVMKATDLLIARGNVDPGRMAAAGGSYGGYLVNWIAGHTDRFQALVSHAGVYDLLGQWSSDATWGRQHKYGGFPYTALAHVERESPNRFAAGFRTPMLILHGERDFRVPYAQGLELYGVLTAKGVPARLVVYPDENHWVLKGLNAKHWYGEVLGFLARYLKG
jgi:dipeptidyl aminopeptidase/acylaminoacyl peptidase